MRIKLIYVFIFLYCFLFGQKQEKNINSILEIKYNYNFVTDTLSNNRNEEVMILDLNNATSSFYSEKNMLFREAIESKLSNYKASNGMLEINSQDLPKVKVKFSVFKEEDKIFVTTLLGKNHFMFEAKVPIWNTKYLEEQKILGYKCNKATIRFNKRNYIAWYSKEISIPEGPYRFKGLPGLILQIEDEFGYDKMYAISIEKKKKKIFQFQRGVSLSREEYIKKREEFKKDPYPGTIMDKEKKERLIRSYMKVNNSLER